MSMQLSVSLKLAWVMQLVQHHLLIPGLCHILVKQGSVWLQYRISPLIFNFLLVYATALTLLKPNPMWLPGAEQPFPRAGELHSRGWQGPCSAPSLSSSLCTQGTFGIILRALGMDGPGGNGNIQEKAEAVVWGNHTPLEQCTLAKKVLEPGSSMYYTNHRTLWEWLSYSVALVFFFILTGKIANLLTSSVSTAGCVKGRVRRRAVNRIKAWAFTSLVSCPWESCCEMWNLWQPWLLQSRSNEH